MSHSSESHGTHDLNGPMSDPSMTGDLGTARDYVLRYVAQMQVGVEFRPEFILAAGGDRFPKKEIYNALTYMARTGDIKRVGYGRYEVATDVECNLSWQFRAEASASLITKQADEIERLTRALDEWSAWAEGLSPAEISRGHAKHILAAKAEEREACVKLAATHGRWGTTWEHNHTALPQVVSREIAAAIRARTP